LTGIPEDCRPRHARRDLFEQFQPFACKAVFNSHETGKVAARVREAVNEAGTNRITGNRKYDRDGTGHLQ
jgi:hypothetical protein